jgi:nucleoside-diphosphate-sugar epimerase
MSDPKHLDKGANCLVTGGVGFLGSHLCRRLLAMGARVTALDIEDAHSGTFFSHLGLPDRVPAVTHHCADSAVVDRIVELAPDYIFHLAGLPYAPYTTAHPAEADAANVTSTKRVLQAALKSRDVRIVFASSACVFGATRESPLAVGSPYSEPAHYYTVTKRRAEDVLLKGRVDSGADVIVCRFGNIYGPGDRHFGRIVPQICSQLITLDDCQQITLRRSRGDSIYEFLYVADAVDGLLKAATSDAAATTPVWHFTGGPSSRTSVLDLAARLSQLYDGGRRDVVPCLSAPERSVVKYLDASATYELLGFEPSVEFDRGLSRTIDWYRSHIGSLKPHPAL